MSIYLQCNITHKDFLSVVNTRSYRHNIYGQRQNQIGIAISAVSQNIGIASIMKTKMTRLISPINLVIKMTKQRF